MLGYIFEKYINQKQMGAYYTKEDITGYICRNTILPFLLDKLGEHALRCGPPAARCATSSRTSTRRSRQDEYLPTETEREHDGRHEAAGRQSGPTSRRARSRAVNDLITYNLDIESLRAGLAGRAGRPA